MEVKKQRKYLVVIAILTMLAVVLSACRSGTDNTEKPDKDALKPLGKIQVIAREDGSGTRAVFAQMTGLEQKESTKNAGDMTRTDAEIQDSGEAVLEVVENSQSAIGYVSMGLLGDTTEVKALSVDGVAPETEPDKKRKLSAQQDFLPGIQRRAFRTGTGFSVLCERSRSENRQQKLCIREKETCRQFPVWKTVRQYQDQRIHIGRAAFAAAGR